MNWLSWLTVEEPTTGALIALGAHVAAAVAASSHILLTKESPRSTAGWLALAWMSPFLGALLYVVFGVNRVRRKAVKLKAEAPAYDRYKGESPDLSQFPDLASLAPLQRSIDKLCDHGIVGPSRFVPLVNGEAALPEMLAAIEHANVSIALETFIFDRDAWGLRFVKALGDARRRGVEIKLLIDGVGTYFSRPTVLRALRAEGVPFRRFLWSYNPLRMTLLNLRNHRKVLVVDGRIGFTGGMNIRGSFVQEAPGPRTAHEDLHAKIEGPLVADLMALFATDWAFETGELLDGDIWFPTLDGVGDVYGRVIPDGPDEDIGKAEFAFLSALSTAQESAKIITPYFLPETPLMYGLAAAARRGVEVDVLVPWKSNHPWVDWAMRRDLPFLLEHGVRVWGQVGPFDHTKLMVVDDTWVCAGSANWDPRSLRLNFEMLVETYSRSLGAQAAQVFAAKKERSRPFEASALESRALWQRLRDGLARLFKPYL